MCIRDRDKGGEQDWHQPLQTGTNDIGFDYSFIMAATGDRVPCVFVENDQVINLDPADPIQVSYKKNFMGEPTGKNNPESVSYTHLDVYKRQDPNWPLF